MDPKEPKEVKKTNWWLPVGIVVLLVIIVAGLSVWQRSKTNTGEIKIGLVGPFSGPTAVFGQMIQNGMDLALSQIPEADRSRVVIVKEDDQCSAAAGVTAVNKLITVDKVKYIIGPMCNESVLASEKLVNDNKILALTIGLPSADIANMGQYHFAFSPEIEQLMKTEAQEMIDQGYTKTAILHIDSPFQTENYTQFKKHYEALGGTLVADETAQTGATTFQTQLLKMKNANPQALMLSAHTADLVMILKQMKEQGMDSLPKYGIHAAETPDVLAAAGSDGLIYPYPADRDEVTSAKDFYAAYKAKYGYDADPYSSNVFDSLKLLVTYVNKCGYENTSCVQSKFANLKDYHGANGILSVDSRGVGTYETILLKKISGGAFTKLTQ